jgi:nucleotide-binding universal stress UspA family protein
MDTHVTILVPLDGTAFSRSILAHITQLFPPATTKLMLVHIVPPVEGYTSPPPRPIALAWPMLLHETARDAELAHHPIYAIQQEQSVRAASMHELEAIAREMQQHGYTVMCDVSFGVPAEAIVAYAASQHVQLIAMATHARSGVSHVFLGSVAEEVVRLTNLPVLLVHTMQQQPAVHSVQQQELFTQAQQMAE